MFKDCVIRYALMLNGTVNINFNANSGECYSLSIILDNATYYGHFNV